MKAIPLSLFAVTIACAIASLPARAADNAVPAPEAVQELPAYLEQVKQGNLSIQAAISNNHALGLAVHEAEAAFSPYLSGEVSHVDEIFPYVDPLESMFTGDRYLDTFFNLSLSKRWTTGTLTTISYRNDWVKTEYPGGGMTLGPGLPAINLAPSSDPYYTAAPNITISQPLWKDFMAAGPKATIDKVRAQSISAQMLNKFKIQQILFSAQQAYIQLSLARSVVEIQTASLERNRKILAWAKAREASNLSDRVDTLQSEAAVKQVEVGLIQAKEDLQNAIIQYNTLRGHDSAEQVAPLSELSLAATGVERKAKRTDLLAAEWDLKNRQAAVVEVTEKYLPDISVYGSATLNGRDTVYNNAFSQSWESQYPTFAFGIKFTANLDLPLIHDTLEGAKLVSSSGDEDYLQKLKDLDRDWSNLERRWDSVSQRLQAARELEELQKEKADREKVRFRNGRTTNYQVLRFEEDYDQAQMLKLRYLAEAAIVLAQAQLYNGDLY